MASKDADPVVGEDQRELKREWAQLQDRAGKPAKETAAMASSVLLLQWLRLALAERDRERETLVLSSSNVCVSCSQSY
jgi:hypothetical protein